MTRTTRTKSCCTCGDDMPKNSPYINCLACREPYATPGVCATPGCTKAPNGKGAKHCNACMTERRLGGDLMAELAAARPLLAGWHAVSARRSGCGSARWWR